MAKAIMTDEQIRETAYLIWLDEGQPEGRDTQHWLQAAELLTKAKPKAKPARKAAAKPRATKAAPKAKAAPKKSAT